MIKKITLFLALLFVGIYSSYAQQNPFSFGIKVGANLSNAAQESDYVMAGDVASKFGYQVGMLAEYSPKGKFYVSSGISLTNKGAKHQGEEAWIGGSNPPVTKWERTTNQVYLQIPLLAGYNVFVSDRTKIRVNAGPYFAYGIGGKERVKTKTTPSEAMKAEKLVFNTFDDGDKSVYSPYNLDREDFGASFGIGIGYNKFLIGLDYELGLSNIYKMEKDHISSTIPGTYKNRNIALTVGYLLK